MPVKFYGATDTDPGEWFTWREDGTERIQLKVRRLPPAKASEIEVKHLGRRWEVRYRRKHAVQEFDRGKTQAVNQDKAAYCLLDSQGFDLEAAGPDAAGALTKALGREVAPGEVVKLDGCWSEELKQLLFVAVPQLVDFVGTKANELAGLDEDEDEDAAGN